MRCPNCGNENPPDYVFCDECGARLLDDAGTGTTDTDAPSGPSGPTVSTTEDGMAQTSDEGESPAGMGVESGNDQGNQEPGFSSMVVTPSLSDTSHSDQGQSQMADAGMPGDGGWSPAEAAPEVPVTEDTMAPGTDGDNTDADATVGEQSMPGVVEMDSSGMGYQEDTEATASPPDISPAASGAPDVAEDTASTTWASTALNHLDQAQQAMARGDYAGYGLSLGSLRSLLEGISAGSAAIPEVSSMAGAGASGGLGSDIGTSLDAGMGAEAVAATQDYSYSATDVAAGSESGATSDGNAATSAESLGSVPVVEPAAEAGTLAAEPAMSSDGQVGAQSEPATPVSVSAPMPGSASEGGSTVARLVVISTGAELPLPEQEEISVGREDPSSGIFPDVDLTPYGGEEGGVSRRHARLLYIGNEYFVEDLQSTNFTKLDGQRLPAHAREKIEDGARLDFGRVAVIFRRS